MSVYYAHSVQAINDLLSNKIDELPVVVFPSAQEAQNHPNLIALHNTKCFGIYQKTSEHVPVFIVSDRNFLYGEGELQGTKRKLVMFPELIGTHNVEVQRPNGDKELVDFVNETITYNELIEYFYRLYTQTLLDSYNIDLQSFTIQIDGKPKEHNNPNLAVSYINIRQFVFDRLFADFERQEDGTLLMTIVPDYLEN